MGSSCRIARAVLTASCPYSSGLLCPSCQGPSISLPRHHMRMAYGSTAPFAIRWSESVVPDRMFAYSSTSSASCTPRVPRFTAYMSSLSTFLSQLANSSRPISFVSVECQARSRRRGRFSTRPDAVLPAVPREEIASGVADRAHAELLDERDHVAPEPLFVGVRVLWLVDAVVYASPQVLDKGAEEPAVDRPHDEMRVDGEMRGDQGVLSFGSGWSMVAMRAGYFREPTVSPPRQ